MRYRPLGRTGLMVSEIGFGAWGIGGVTPGATSYGATDDGVSLAALRRAVDLGVTFYDTSNVYGDGHSEELIGRAFAGMRDRVVLATKAGRRDYATDSCSPADLRASLEGSLKRFGTDYVDLLQLHADTIGPEGYGVAMDTFRRLKAEGKVRACGISAKSPEQAVSAIRDFGAEVVQVNFNLVDQRAVDSGLLGVAAEAGVGVIARTPLCFGMLSGKLSAAVEFPPGDHRAAWSREQIARWIEASRMFVDGIAESAAVTGAQVALRFCLSQPEISTVIPGMMAPAEVEENVRASDAGPLAAADLARIGEIYRGNEFFVRRR